MVLEVLLLTPTARGLLGRKSSGESHSEFLTSLRMSCCGINVLNAELKSTTHKCFFKLN